jgi:hypothetical protein
MEQKMRLPALLTLAALALINRVQAHAEPQTPSNADTYKEVVAHGVVIMTPGLEIDVKFNPDGTFIALGGLSKGTWKIVGDKLCSTPGETLIESCAIYPAGKKSGDQFELDAPGGRVPIKIK